VEPIVKVTIQFLKLIGVEVNNDTVNKTLQNHPDWPSLLCISDSLSTWNIPNVAAKAIPQNLDQLPIPFIAYTKDKENPFVIVSKADNKYVEIYSKSFRKAVFWKKELFLKEWDGIYLLAAPTEQSGEINYKRNKFKYFYISIIPVSLFLIGTILSFTLINFNIVTFNIFNSTPFYLQYFILLIGVMFTSMMLWYEIDKNNPILHKVCTGIIKGNCNAVLTSNASKLLSWLSWSEIGFFYFAGGLLTFLFGGNVGETITIIAWLNIAALPYIIFSIYYQGVIAKEWCFLCLSVQALLLFGGLNCIANNLLNSITSISFFTFGKALLFYIFTALFWYTIKPIILYLQKTKTMKKEYLRIKFNTEIFETILKKQKFVTEPIDGLGIDLGNPRATNTLIKVCNPYCGPCAKAHPQIEKLLEENKNIKVKIIFSVSSGEDDFRAKPVKHLLAVAENNDEMITRQALDDWYLAEKKDYEMFANKYLIGKELSKQGNKIVAMDKWCKEMNIRGTPTYFLNGYQIPDVYGIGDLKYFLAE
jgi:thiol-disulfide isomerase/thioredoxin